LGSRPTPACTGKIDSFGASHQRLLIPLGPDVVPQAIFDRPGTHIRDGARKVAINSDLERSAEAFKRKRQWKPCGQNSQRLGRELTPALGVLNVHPEHARARKMPPKKGG